MVGAAQPYGLSKVRANGRTVLSVSGEIDIATVDDVGAAVRAELASGPVVLDFHQLSFMDSSGLRMLVDLLREAEQAGWSLRIHNELHHNVWRLLDLAGMLDELPFDGGAPPEPS